MSPYPTRSEIINALWTREQSARVIGFHPSNLDRLKAEGRVHPLVNENGRAIAYFKEEILSMVGGTYRRKPPGKPKSTKKPVKEGGPA
jgi:hypothetical protein